jgi:hypothetical protein
MKKLICLRGHDTSQPESRDKQGLCIECRKLLAVKKYKNPAYQAKAIARSRKTTANMTSEKLRRINLRKRFGLTLEQYQQMYDAQNGRCAICKEHERRLGKDDKPLPLSVDHDHKTNKVRKLLCGDCNTAIGLMKENILCLQSAIEYLVTG